MKPRTKARLAGGAILLFNLGVIGAYNLDGPVVLLMTFGFAAAFEYGLVRNIKEE